jgi:hypothetical protein
MFGMSNSSAIDKILIGLLVLLVASVIVLSCVPPVTKDELVHHLALPKLYLKHGGMYEIPFMNFSYYPMNLQLLYMIPLAFGQDLLPKFIHFAFALLSAWLVFGYLKKRLNTAYALFGMLFFLSLPIIIKLSITAYIDLGVIFFSAGSLLLILKWMESGFSRKYLILSGIMCGLGLGTKYNGLITFFLLTLFIPFLYSRYAGAKKPSFSKAAAQGILFFSISLLVFSPWMARNYAWTGNPVYPLYDRWLSPSTGDSQDSLASTQHQRAELGHFTVREALYHETWWEIALLPVRVFFQGKDGSPKYFDGKLNPFLLLLPLFSLYRREQEDPLVRAEKNILMAFVVLYFSFALFSTALRIRYIAPIIPPLAILSAYGLKRVYDLASGVHSRWKQAATSAAMIIPAISLGLNGDYLYSQFEEVRPFSYLNGSVSREEYISNYCFEYPALKYMNESLGTDARVLFVFLGDRGYYCDRDYVLDNGALSRIVKRASDSKEVLLGLRQMGITHLLIRYDIFDPWSHSDFDGRQKQVLQEFMETHTKLLYGKWGYGVSRLLGSELAG